MSERSAVQNPMIRYATQIGWRYLAPAEALRLRGGETGLFLHAVLGAQLQLLNPAAVDGAGAEEIMRRLTLLRAAIEGNRDMLGWLRGEGSLFVAAERRERNITLIDFAQPERNLFHVSDEWRYRGAAFANRADLVFLINGVPVAIAETKKAGKADGLAEGIEQLRRYQRETPELLLPPQLAVVTELVGFFYGATWSLSRKQLFNWKEELGGPQQPAPDFERSVTAFFDRPRLLRVLRDYIIFLSRDDQLTKIVLRQHQTRAVEKALARIVDPTKRRGLIWHTQGSGKTLTMITIAARLLRETPGGEKPTVLMVVDRNELEAQLFKNITGVGITAVEVAQSKRDLERLLRQDYRGLIVSMIHKFDAMPADVNRRASIIALVDEAHRTTGGDLGTYLEAAIPNATWIGFTGTPIDKLSQGKGTFKIFGGDDAQGYLDKYSIAESVEDGTTVRLNYALAPSDLLVERATLEREFLDLADAEGVSDIEELNAILRKAVTLTEAMKAPDRVDKIARYVAAHFQQHVEPMGFKAFLVAVDRPACASYKTALDRYLPKHYSQVVYSPAHNDRPELKKHYLSDEQEKEVRKAFARKGDTPKILIVTEKLLTGFDAPILYCMYLDKPMRDHVLLQAIARVNRPYEDDEGQKKPYGFVLDFVGIFERLNDALAFDADVVASVIQNIEVLHQLFQTLMTTQAAVYLPLAGGNDDKANERAIDYFRDRTGRERFFALFRQLQSLYDILSPDGRLRPLLDDYHALAELFALVRSAYAPGVYVDKELTAKTRALLHTHTTLRRLADPREVYELGPQQLAAIRQTGESDHVRVLNLRRLLAQAVATQGQAQPFLLSIGEQAEGVMQLYEERQITTRQALDAFERLAQQAVAASDEQQQLGLGPNAYTIFTVVRTFAPAATAAQASDLDAILARFPDYAWNPSQGSSARAALYHALLPLVGEEQLIDAADAILRIQRL